MSSPRSLSRHPFTQEAPVAMPGLALDSQDPAITNPVFVEYSGQELQALAQRDDLGSILASPEVGLIQVVLRPRLALDVNVAALSGLGTYQSVAIQDGDFLVLLGQTDKTQNGPWIAHANIAGVAQVWTRPALPFGYGSMLYVLAGNYAGQVLLNTNVGTIVYGTTQVTFARVPTGSSPLSAQSYLVGPSDTLTGVTAETLFAIGASQLAAPLAAGLINTTNAPVLVRATGLVRALNAHAGAAEIKVVLGVPGVSGSIIATLPSATLGNGDAGEFSLLLHFGKSANQAAVPVYAFGYMSAGVSGTATAGQLNVALGTFDMTQASGIYPTITPNNNADQSRLESFCVGSG